MNFNYKKSQSIIYPQLADTTSSKTTVYLRKNVEEKQRTDEMTDDIYTYYEYDEAKIPKAQYEKHLQEQARADIDYIALMTGVDLEETEGTE